MKRQNGFLPILLLAIIIVSFIGILVGVYGGFKYYKTSKLVKETNQFVKGEKAQQEAVKTSQAEAKVKQEGSEKKIKETKESVELGGVNWQWVNGQKKLYQLSSSEANLILEKLWERFLNQDDRLRALSILRLGTPYQSGCLGEESGRDKDPIFRLDVTDCTVFVLTDIALLHSHTLKEAKEMMKYLNYRPQRDPKTGKLIYKTTFENRLHFTTDRNETSPYFENITKQVAGPDKVKEKELVLNKIKPDGKRLIDIDWQKDITIDYLPNKFITKEFLQGLPNVLGVAFIKEGDGQIGLDVRHEGLLFDGKTLFHASSLQKKVVAEDFLEYYFNKGNNHRFDGILLFEIK